MRTLVVLLGVASATLVACGSSSSLSPLPTLDGADAASHDDDAAAFDAGGGDVDASAREAGALTGKCASRFGTSLTEGFGRIDGIVYAVQKPSDVGCVMPNDDHVIVQVLMNGSVYRLVTNVQGSFGDPKIRIRTMAHALPSPAFAEGWHAGAPLDYVTSLGVHSDASFTPSTLEEGVATIANELTVGDPVSIYATSGGGRPESAHLIHRNKPNQDGAIVVSPTTTPRFLLFHFSTQTF